MKLMKKFGLLSILGAAVLAGALVGCSGGEKPAEEPNKPSTGGSAAKTDGKKMVIGVSIPAADHGWTAGIKYWADQGQKEFSDVEWVIQTAKTPQEQIESIDAMVAKKIDGLVILATESAPLTPKAVELHDKGIFIVNVDRGFDKDVADVFVAGDNELFGTRSAEYMVKRLNGKGKVLVLTGIPCTVDTARVKAAEEVFKKNPGIQVLDKQAGMWNRQTAYEKMVTMLVKNKDIDAIWAQDDDMALGAEQALKEAGLDKKVWILGGAGMKDIIKRVMDKDPMFPADIMYSPSMIKDGMKAMVEAMKAKKEGKTFEKKIILPVDLVEPENAKKYYFPDSVY
jgi:ribose transport system substrate-binding protein